MAMDAFAINGGKRLRGLIRVNGAKNASLPLMAAALLTDEPVVLHDVPMVADVRNMARLLGTLGCDAQLPNDDAPDDAGNADQDRSARIHVTDRSPCVADYDIVRTMRASICVLGPLLARRGKARVSMPGGCNIGDRPVDLHLRGLQALGAKIHLDQGYIVAEADHLHGGRVFLGGSFGSTVLGTANVMSAACLAKGTTVIESAACEPEIVDLAQMLIVMGAQITGAGSPRVTIEGVEALRGVEHSVIPDRIEAGTYAIAAAITNGDVTIENFPFDTLTAVLDRLAAIGVEVEPTPPVPEAPESTKTPPSHITHMGTQTARIAASRRLEPVQVVTQPFPGFPTDLQAQVLALLCLADGNSLVTDKIFPDRFLHVAELLRMGASLYRNGSTVLITGVRELIGAPVMASDLRASAGLVLAGLAARGTTVVNRVYHLDRGYNRMDRVLQALGADIERVSM